MSFYMHIYNGFMGMSWTGELMSYHLICDWGRGGVTLVDIVR